MKKEEPGSIKHYWHYRKRRKSYKRIKLILACYMIIFSVILLKDLFQVFSEERTLEVVSYILHPMKAISWGWFSAILLQSATIVAIFVNTLVGQELMAIDTACYLMIGLILGNSATPLFASLLVRSKKHWDIRHGFEVGVANVVYSILLAMLVIALQLTTGIYSKTGSFLQSTLAEYPAIGFLPTVLDLIVSPVFQLLRIDQWPLLLSLVFSIVLLIWAFHLFGESVTRYFGGVKRSQEKIKEHLGSRWKTFSIGLVLSIFIPSSSLLVTLLVPLAAKNLITLRQAIPYLIATNLATFIDVLIIAFANGSPGAISGALVLMLMSLLGIVFMNEKFGIRTIHKLTRFCTMRFLPPKKRYIILFLAIYTLIPLLISIYPS